MNSKVIFTCLTSNYDQLLQYEVLSSEYDYICFSNDFKEGTKIGHWLIKSIPFACEDNIRLSRYVKIQPHKVLCNYEWSVWLDANLAIKDKAVYNSFDECIRLNKLWAGIRHPKRNCIYDDARECLRIGRAKYIDIKKHVNFLRDQNYPRQMGLFENNIILRAHNNPLVKSLDEQWWDIYSLYSKRDQHSLFYVFWKNNFKPSLIFSESMNARNTSYIDCVRHAPLSVRGNINLRFREIRYRILLQFIKLFDF